jgi:hypothetical protein
MSGFHKFEFIRFKTKQKKPISNLVNVRMVPKVMKEVKICHLHG